MEQVIDIIYTLFIVCLCIRLTGMSKVAGSATDAKTTWDLESSLLSGFRDICMLLYRLATTHMMASVSKEGSYAERIEFHAKDYYLTMVPVGLGMTGKRASRTSVTETRFRGKIARNSPDTFKLAAEIIEHGHDKLAVKKAIFSFLEKHLQDVLFGLAPRDGKNGMPAAVLFNMVPTVEFESKTLPANVSKFIEACTDACIENAQQQEAWTKEHPIGKGTLLNACWRFEAFGTGDIASETGDIALETGCIALETGGIAAVIRALPRQKTRELLLRQLGLADEQIATAPVDLEPDPIIVWPVDAPTLRVMLPDEPFAGTDGDTVEHLAYGGHQATRSRSPSPGPTYGPHDRTRSPSFEPFLEIDISDNPECDLASRAHGPQELIRTAPALAGPGQLTRTGTDVFTGILFNYCSEEPRL